MTFETRHWRSGHGWPGVEAGRAMRKAVDTVCTYHDIHASLLHLMGLDHKRLTYFFNGRHMRRTDVHGELIPGIAG